MQYRCKQGDVLDAICATHYGTEHGTTELVLRANPGLSARDVHLPTGLLIELPEIVAPAPVTQTVKLWD
jgi:phage tail protein X